MTAGIVGGALGNGGNPEGGGEVAERAFAERREKTGNDFLPLTAPLPGEVMRSPALAATLRAIAERQPATLADLQGIPGLGQAKLQAYGAEVLRVVNP